MAPPPPLVALRDARVSFGERPLFDGVTLALARGERACLVGRNGSGKSTLLRTLAGAIELDRGDRLIQPGVRVAYLPQDPMLPAGSSVADHVACAMSAEGAPARHRVDAALALLRLDRDRDLATLSGGEGRRVALARAFVTGPDVLLLDEPTNHLDLPTIEWLEVELGRFPGAMLVVSHDRAFLSTVSRITLWLDRARLHRLDSGFVHFEEWAEQLRQQEAQHAHRLDRQIAREEHWLQRGVTARRRRNQGRLARLKDLRRRRSEWLHAPGPAKLGAATAETGGETVIEATNVSQSFTGEGGSIIPIVGRFSTRIRRGDRIGVIGPNGVGKTTLVRLLIGQLAPDSGSVRLGSNIRPLYFDQRRETLEPEATLWETLVPGGGDALMVSGRQRHVVAYLRDFLFEEGQAQQPTKSLSGGEKSRLLLARLFARPSNLVVLDEPTNDLDLETLDLLAEVLDGYGGTLLVVSHDRDFLDRLVTGIIAFEGSGRVREYAGGYSDYLAQRPREAQPTAQGSRSQRLSKNPPRSEERPAAKRKLSYHERRELQRLPAQIECLGTQVRSLERKLTDPDLYRRDPGQFQAVTAELEAARLGLAAAEQRWLELEDLHERLAGEGVAR